jgi:hypothetical protein
MAVKFRLERTKQCVKCPWRKATNPHKIPNGYSVEKHRALVGTIANPERLDLAALASPTLHVMACHETHNSYCLGWLMNQLGSGNNIALRLAMSRCENLREVTLRGEQHERFEDTLPTAPARTLKL